MKVRIISFTPGGAALGRQLEQTLAASRYTACHTPFSALENGLEAWVAEGFATDGGLIFIGAAGIAVRVITPYLKSKTTDPAVVVMDEQGRFAIPLVSGHMGGANDMARALAALTGGQAVITTATDINGLFSVDSWAVSQGLWIHNPHCIKAVSSKLLAGQSICLRSDFPLEGAPPKGVVVDNDRKDYDVYIGYKTRGRQDALKLIPRIITAGVGCRRAVPADEIGRALDMALAKGSLHAQAICRVCSIDLKAAEPGLLTCCRERDLPFETFTPVQLAEAKGNFSSSTFVQSITGVDNVCERSAVLGSGGSIILKKQVQNGVTVALAASPCVLKF